MIGKNGKETRFTHFSFKIFPSSLPYSRFGVILKKGIAKKAVDRNRTRRMIFDAIRKSNAPVTLLNRDIIIIVGKSATQLPQETLSREIHSAISCITVL